eukprot:scaffold105738_cov40-Prasinocladus_malaysianus.AAC.1
MSCAIEAILRQDQHSLTTTANALCASQMLTQEGEHHIYLKKRKGFVKVLIRTRLVRHGRAASLREVPLRLLQARQQAACALRANSILTVDSSRFNHELIQSLPYVVNATYIVLTRHLVSATSIAMHVPTCLLYAINGKECTCRFPRLVLAVCLLACHQLSAARLHFVLTVFISVATALRKTQVVSGMYYSSKIDLTDVIVNCKERCPIGF